MDHLRTPARHPNRSCFLTALNMNPYSPPASSLQQTSQPQRSVLRHPARFLLYPSAAFCTFFFFGMGSRLIQEETKVATVHFFLSACSVILLGLFGFSALLLSTRRISQYTRRFTILWSIAACCYFLTPVFFGNPIPSEYVVFFIISISVSLSVGLLSLRISPHEPNMPPT